MVEDRARKRSRGWLVWGLGNHIIGNLLCKQKIWSNGVTWLFMHGWKTALGLCGLLRGKESAYQSKRGRFNPWVRKIPWRRKWQPTQLCLPGESHGQRRLAGNSPWGLKESDVTEYTHTLAQAANYIRKKEKKDSSDCSGYDRWSGKDRGQGERREGTQIEIAVIIQVRDEEDQNSCQGMGKVESRGIQCVFKIWWKIRYKMLGKGNRQKQPGRQWSQSLVMGVEKVLQVMYSCITITPKSSVG